MDHFTPRTQRVQTPDHVLIAVLYFALALAVVAFCLAVDAGMDRAENAYQIDARV